MSNEDRIKQWREGRLKQAEKEREERVRRAREQADLRARHLKQVRLEEASARNTQQRELAEVLLPTEESILAEQQAAEDRRRARAKRGRQRLFGVVGIPTCLAALYAFLYATPFYEALAVFTVQTIGESSAASTPGILNPGMSVGDLKRGFEIREYLLSRDAMEKMEKR